MIGYIIEYKQYVFILSLFIVILHMCVSLQHMMEFYEKVEPAGLNIVNIWAALIIKSSVEPR